MKPTQKLILIILVLTLTIIFIVGCAPKQTTYGKPIPTDAKITKVSAVLANIEKYSKEESVIEGVIGSMCPAGGYFFLQDETGQIFVYNHPTNIYISAKPGTKVKVMGKVWSTKQGIMFVGDGVSY
ncbi:MAG TPA: hypothetical protein PLZ08_10430 [Bacillota bacterium]|jgi:outer membrane lipoprotein-sorting protein|nr:hypothetical protein [Bacillota bacterium]HOL10669.1 hypothetical protein [Bacillota bacterium]HPO98354.1 hypothetical protein [Bacillota bacterium]